MFFYRLVQFSPHEAVSVQVCLLCAHINPSTEGPDWEALYRDVTLHPPSTLLQTRQKQQADRWGLSLGAGVGGEAMCCCCVWGLVCICEHDAYAFIHKCLSVHMHVHHFVNAFVCTCVCIFGWDRGCCGGGGSHGAALCLFHLPPHSSDTQGNGREGVGNSF